ncbi:MAG: GNAT family N-acetyltransferase [Anaerolineales bacterium]|nr:GNAT family N-acetyltransferase [Anaerolineales bacterium]
MDSTHKILPITLQTCREAAYVLGCAFADEPVSLAIYINQTPEERIRNLAVDFAIEVEDCIRRGIALQMNQADKIVAVAAIYPPGAYPFPWIFRARMTMGAFLDYSHYSVRRLLDWQRFAGKIHPKEPHFYFQYLGVRPECQGKGYGTLMMQYLTALADEANMPCYLETASAGAVPMYRRYGFEVLVEKEIIGVHAWFMWREPHLLP